MSSAFHVIVSAQLDFAMVGPGVTKRCHQCSLSFLQVVVQGRPASASEFVKLAFQLSLGGPAVGIAFAICLSAWLKCAGGKLFADLGMTLVAAYGSFHVADILGCSNILATVALGMCMALYGWSTLKMTLQEPMNTCW